MFYFWTESQENAKYSFRETSLKNDTIAKVHLDGEQASHSGKISLNMSHLVLFLVSSICRVTRFPYSYFPHHRVSEPFFLLKVKSL